MTRPVDLSPKSQPIVGVLHRMSAHLDDLAARVYHVEHAIGDDLLGAGPQAASNIQRLQTLDLLRQSLEDMALLTLYLSQCSDLSMLQVKQPQILADKLSLDVTKSLLMARLVPSPSSYTSESNGDVDLF